MIEHAFEMVPRWLALLLIATAVVATLATAAAVALRLAKDLSEIDGPGFKAFFGRRSRDQGGDTSPQLAS